MSSSEVIFWTISMTSDSVLFYSYADTWFKVWESRKMEPNGLMVTRQESNRWSNLSCKVWVLSETLETRPLLQFRKGLSYSSETRLPCRSTLGASFRRA
ncbi:hypothetical protein HanPSC8_Chr15g0675411 [Helianthus annuus]|nr:hypothetical protein HanPSC8_Chr15g0675411 [Helianthus annuus]